MSPPVQSSAKLGRRSTASMGGSFLSRPRALVGRDLEGAEGVAREHDVDGGAARNVLIAHDHAALVLAVWQTHDARAASAESAHLGPREREPRDRGPRLFPAGAAARDEPALAGDRAVA